MSLRVYKIFGFGKSSEIFDFCAYTQNITPYASQKRQNVDQTIADEQCILRNRRKYEEHFDEYQQSSD